MNHPDYPFHFREDGVLVDANGKPVPPLPIAPNQKRGPIGGGGGPAKLRKKPNPLMITSDFNPKDQDE